MLSPYKLYKHDMKNQRVARTWGPKGKPYAGCKGSICYRHKNVDWTVHRLAPTIHERAPVGSKRRKAVEAVMTHPTHNSKIVQGNKRLANRLEKRLPKKVASSTRGQKVISTVRHGTPTLEGMSRRDAKNTSSFLKKSSPRWGEGKVPGRMEGRHVVAHPQNMEVSKHTYAAVGAAVAIGGGAYAYKHRADIKAKAHNFAGKHPHFVHGFHSSHQGLHTASSPTYKRQLKSGKQITVRKGRRK